MRVLLVWNGPATVAEADPLVRRQVPLLEALMHLGVQPTVALLGDRGGLAREIRSSGAGLREIPVPLPPSGKAFRTMPQAVYAIRAILRETAFDIIEGDEPMPAIAVGLAARGTSRAVRVYRRHHPDGRRRLIVASRVAAHLCHRTMVSTETMRRCAATQDRTPLDRIHVACSGTPAPAEPSAIAVAAVRGRFGIPAGAPVVGVVSRLRQSKGLDVLLASLDHLANVPALHVVIAGEGPEREALGSLAERSAVPVHFAGHQSDIAPWLATFDVVAMPSRSETFGRVTLEAMAAGRPLVASRVGGLIEAVVDGETGLLVEPDNPEALAGALRILLRDPSRARTMGEAGRSRFRRHFTMDSMAASWRTAWADARAAETEHR